MTSSQNNSDNPLVNSSKSPNSEDDTLSLFSCSPKSISDNSSSLKYYNHSSKDITNELKTNDLLNIFKIVKPIEDDIVANNKKNKEDINKKIEFYTEKLIKGKRGRKIKHSENNEYINKRMHISKDFDNLQTKIQVHFITFIIDISNDALII